MAGRAARWLALPAVTLIVAGCGLPLVPQAVQPTPHALRSADPVANAARESAHPDPNFDYGQTVQITAAGFHPAVLVSECCKAVTWRNLTSAPVAVAFDHQRVSSGSIAAGGSWDYTPPNMGAVTYHLDGHPDVRGAVQVNQMFESMSRDARREVQARATA